MGVVKPKEIADNIIASFDIRSCEIVDICIERAIRTLYPTLGETQVFDTVDAIKESVKHHIDRYIEDCVFRGSLPHISWSTRNPERIIGCAFEFKDDTSEVIVIKRRLILLPDIWNAVHELSPDEFEHFCRKLLLERGFHNIEVTQRTRDGGIDFKGETQHGMSPFTFNMTVVGQAKRYDKTNSITESQMRDLWGSVHDSSLAGKKTLAVFITTSQFTTDALKFAKRNGILTSDGDQISLSVAEIGIGIKENEAGYPLFAKQELRRWVSDTS